MFLKSGIMSYRAPICYTFLLSGKEALEGLLLQPDRIIDNNGDGGCGDTLLNSPPPGLLIWEVSLYFTWTRSITKKAGRLLKKERQ